jgi:hypothetical protein
MLLLTVGTADGSLASNTMPTPGVVYGDTKNLSIGWGTASVLGSAKGPKMCFETILTEKCLAHIWKMPNSNLRI